MKPMFFSSQERFRQWLEKNHDTAKELWVGYWKVASGKASMSWSESVDQALCFGWIDGIRKSLDDESYMNRFTPRRPNSVWSKINIEKIERLTKEGLMQPAGVAAYEKKQDHRSAIYSYENRPQEFEPEYEKIFRKNRKAWKYFESQPPGYKRLMIFRVVSAKQEVTRLTRLKSLIDASAEGRRL